MRLRETCTCHIIDGPHNPHHCARVIEAYRDGLKKGREELAGRFVKLLHDKGEEEKRIADSCPPGSMGALSERARGAAFREASKMLEGETACEHEWVDPSNSVVESKEHDLCIKCGRLEKKDEHGSDRATEA